MELGRVMHPSLELDWRAAGEQKLQAKAASAKREHQVEIRGQFGASLGCSLGRTLH